MSEGFSYWQIGFMQGMIDAALGRHTCPFDNGTDQAYGWNEGYYAYKEKA